MILDADVQRLSVAIPVQPSSLHSSAWLLLHGRWASCVLQPGLVEGCAFPPAMPSSLMSCQRPSMVVPMDLSGQWIIWVPSVGRSWLFYWSVCWVCILLFCSRLFLVSWLHWQSSMLLVIFRNQRDENGNRSVCKYGL